MDRRDVQSDVQVVMLQMEIAWAMSEYVEHPPPLILDRRFDT
jgi:hypothetical protein